MTGQTDFTEEEIEHAIATVARVIDLHGDAYWPVLDRLERELEVKRSKRERLRQHLDRFRQRQREKP